MNDTNYSLLDIIPQGVCIINHKMQAKFWNKTLEDWTGIKKELIIGKELGIFFANLKQSFYETHIQKKIFAESTPLIFSALLHKYFFFSPLENNSYRIQHTTITPIPNEKETEPCAIIFVQDVTDLYSKMFEIKKLHDEAVKEIKQRKIAEDSLHKMALYDSLTTLPNRVLFFDRLNTLILNYEWHKNPFSLFYVDLDKFKEVNDKFGHDAGDFVLSTVAKRFLNELRKTDTVARLGGDEFALLFPDIQNQNQAIRFAESIIKSINEPILYNNIPIQIGLSVGIVIFPNHGSSTEELMLKADKAMYDSKRNKKNCWSLFIGQS